jgi:hypothetical protein
MPMVSLGMLGENEFDCVFTIPDRVIKLMGIDVSDYAVGDVVDMRLFAKIKEMHHGENNNSMVLCPLDIEVENESTEEVEEPEEE